MERDLFSFYRRAADAGAGISGERVAPGPASATEEANKASTLSCVNFG